MQWLRLLWSAGALGLQWLWPEISVAPRRVGSSWIGDRTCVSRNGRRILNHWTTKEALLLLLLLSRFSRVRLCETP